MIDKEETLSALSQCPRSIVIVFNTNHKRSKNDEPNTDSSEEHHNNNRIEIRVSQIIKESKKK